MKVKEADVVAPARKFRTSQDLNSRLLSCLYGSPEFSQLLMSFLCDGTIGHGELRSNGGSEGDPVRLELVMRMAVAIQLGGGDRASGDRLDVVKDGELEPCPGVFVGAVPLDAIATPSLVFGFDRERDHVKSDVGPFHVIALCLFASDDVMSQIVTKDDGFGLGDGTDVAERELAAWAVFGDAQDAQNQLRGQFVQQHMADMPDLIQSWDEFMCVERLRRGCIS